MSSHDYSLFGLTLRSAMALPDLRPAPTSAAIPDVLVELVEPAPLPLAPGRLDRVTGGARFGIEGVGCFTVTDGSRIVCQPVPGTDERNVRLYLLGSAIGLLLHQRGLLPLHAMAVEVGGRAFAFMGHSGAGKSTLAAWFHDRGLRLLADDVCVVTFGPDGEALAWPGLARLRLWRSALEASGRDTAGFARSFVGDAEHDKFDVPIAEPGDGEAVPLAGIYLLTRGDSLGFEQLVGVAALEALFANTYRGGYLGFTDRGSAHWRGCIALAEAVPIFKLERSWGEDRLGEQAEAILVQLEAAASATARSTSSRK